MDEKVGEKWLVIQAENQERDGGDEEHGRRRRAARRQKRHLTFPPKRWTSIFLPTRSPT